MRIGDYLRRVSIALTFVLCATAVLAQDFTFRLRGSSPWGPAVIGNYGILDIAMWGGIFLVVYAAAFTGLKRVSAFEKEQNAAKIIALGVAIATVTFLMSTEYAFGPTIRSGLSRFPTSLHTWAVLIIGLFAGVWAYHKLK